jgi:hypothetical protein
MTPPPGTVWSALLELDFTTESDASGRLVFREKERSDDGRGTVLKRAGFYTATATTFTLHISEDLSYEYTYQLVSQGLVYSSAEDGDRKQFLMRQ